MTGPASIVRCLRPAGRQGATLSAIACVMVLAWVWTAHSANRTWDGNCVLSICNGQPRLPFWTIAENWSGDTAPVAGDRLIFPPASFQFDTMNTFDGGTRFDSIQLNGPYTLTGNPIRLDEGIGTQTGGGGDVELSITLTASQPFTSSPGTILRLKGGTIATGGHQLTLDGTGLTVVTSEVTGTGGITKAGSGIVQFDFDHFYTGDTTVNDGALRIAGDHANSRVVTSSAATALFGGEGDIKGLQANASIEPGLANQGTGILRSVGDVVFSATSQLVIDIRGTLPGTFDQLQVFGGITLSGLPDLVVNLPGTPPQPGDSFPIILNDGGDAMVGSFRTLVDGSQFTVANTGGGTTTFFMTYRGGDGNDVVLHVPRTVTWDGGGANDNWRTAANWVGDRAPDVGDTLVFPTGAARLSNTNDFPQFYRFTAVTVAGGGYSLNGNGVRLLTELAGTMPGGSTSRSSVHLAVTGSARVRQASASGLPLALTADNTYLGGTLIQQGILEVDGLSPDTYVSIEDGMLSGTGRVGAVVTAGTGSTISIRPGSPHPTFGILTTGGVTLDSNSSLFFDVGPEATPGTGHDQLNVVGSVILGNARLRSLNSSTPPAGGTRILINNDGTDAITGTFLNLPEGALFDEPGLVGDTFFVSYRGGDGNDVVAFMPGTIRWTGAGGNDLWSTPANWDLNRAPLPGETLVFPAGPARLTSQNDLPATTTYHSLIVGGGGYTVAGNDIRLSSGLTNTAPGVTTVNAVLSGGGNVTTNGDRLVLTAANTYQGETIILRGTLLMTNQGALGGIGQETALIAGAALELSVPLGETAIAEPLLLAGTGIAGTGALLLTGPGGARWTGPITLNGDVAIGSSLVPLPEGPRLELSGRITGSGGLTKVGNGIVRLSGAVANTYTGATMVNAGTLELSKSAGAAAVSGPITVGDNIDEIGPTRSYLSARADDQIPDQAPITLNGGSLELEDETVGALTLNPLSRVVTTDPAAVVTLTGDVSLNSTTGSAVIAVGRLSLGGATRTFSAVGPFNSVAADLENGSAPAGIVKTGPGTLILTRGNSSAPGTYSGATSISAGTLEIADVGAFGTFGAGTVVSPGAALGLRLPTPGTILAEPLTLSGDGIDAKGALIGRANHVWAGRITLAGDASISVPSGNDTFIIANVDGDGELRKIGPGQLRLARSTRPTRLRSGSLRIDAILERPVTLETGTLLGTGTVGGIVAEGVEAKTISPGQSPGRLTSTGDVTWNQTTVFQVELNGPTPASTYDQLTVTGAVALQDATLTVVPGSPATLDQTFTIIDNDGADPVIGTFAGLPEGAAPTFLGQRFQITYKGGDGNDVVLTRVSDTLPTLSINDVTIAEGNSGTSNALFLVTLSAPSPQQITVQFATADGTATAAAGDYSSRSGTLTFAPNQTTATIEVPVAGDAVNEPDETFTVTLSAPVNALLGDAQAIGKIVNDDGPPVAPTLSVEDVSITEGDASTPLAAATVRLSAPSGVPVTVQFGTADGTAKAGLDYATAAGTVTLAPGVTTVPILVPVIGDTVEEPTETFVLNLSAPVNATLGDGQAVITILDNDAATAGPSVSISPAAIKEGNSGATAVVFAVTLSAATPEVVSVAFAASAETAAAPADFPSQSGVVTFAPNSTTQAVTVQITGDRLVEPDETFLVTLSNPVNARIGDGQARGTILNDDVGPTITIDGPPAITATSPFLTLRGTASDDLGIGGITWTNDRGGSGAAEGTTSWVIRGIPLRKGVNVITVTADDIDGALNPAEVDPSADRLNKASATITVTVNEFLYFLAEGATGSFFDEDIAIANPNGVAAPVTVTFLKEDGTTVPHTLTVPATGRATIAVEQIPGLAATAVSAVVSSTEALPLVVERSMFWDSTYYGAHTGSAVDGAKTTWLFGEGSQGFFDTFVLLANANDASARVTVTFLTESGDPVTRVVTVGATSRLNVFTGAIPELVGRSFSIVVDADRPIIAERAMYFGTPLFNGGHESAGVSEPATSWFHAEGATGAFFDTFILVGNPNAVPATVTFTYLLDTGQVVTRVKTVAPSSRLTVDVEAEDPLLRNAAVSTTVTSSVPVISERAMYWPGAFTTWFEAHNSFGLTEVATKWGLAEGRVGGPQAFETYILLANPNATTANVTVTYLRANGSTVVKTYPVTPTSRFNVFVNGFVPELANEAFGALITSDVPIAVERALYNSSGGVVFAAGSNATAVKIP